MPTRPSLAVDLLVMPGGVPEESVGTLVHRAVDDAREMARAEIALVKAKAGERANAYKNAAIFFGIAAVLALAAIVALLVGLILSLATLVGPGWATAIVIGATLLVVVILAWVGKSKLAPPAKPSGVIR